MINSFLNEFAFSIHSKKTMDKSMSNKKHWAKAHCRNLQGFSPNINIAHGFSHGEGNLSSLQFVCELIVRLYRCGQNMTRMQHE
jgi:hypothetical protein